MSGNLIEKRERERGERKEWIAAPFQSGLGLDFGAETKNVLKAF